MIENGIKYVLRFDDPVAVMEDDEDEKEDFKPTVCFTFDTLSDTKHGTLLEALPEVMGFVLLSMNSLENDSEHTMLICSPEGKSRAPAVVASIMIISQRISAEHALNITKTIHTETDISECLLQQVKAFELITSKQEQHDAFYARVNHHAGLIQQKLKTHIS